MEFAAEVIVWLIAEMLIPPIEWALRPLGNALRSAYGGLVLAAVWLGCGGWFWLAWQFAVRGERAWAETVFLFTILGAPAFAMFSFLVWYHRNDPPVGRRRRGSAY